MSIKQQIITDAEIRLKADEMEGCYLRGEAVLELNAKNKRCAAIFKNAHELLKHEGRIRMDFDKGRYVHSSIPKPPAKIPVIDFGPRRSLRKR